MSPYGKSFMLVQKDMDSGYAASGSQTLHTKVPVES